MIHSFLLIGQSNMAGRGDIAEAIPVNTDHIKVMRNGRWLRMFRPVNPDRSFAGVSLAESFAEAYANKYGVDVGLIPCADGGTSLNQWQPGSILLDNAVYQARLASRTSTIAGILWHQGEADCAEGLHQTYAERFTVIANALREELGLMDVPLLVGGLGDYLADCVNAAGQHSCANYHLVNKQLKLVAATLPRTGFVSAEGLTPKPDILHFNAQSLHKFGLRYFEEFEKLRDPNKVFEEKPHPDAAIRTAMELL